MICLIIALLLSLSTASGQTVYQVPVGSHDNQIVLALANESPNAALEGVAVRPMNVVKAIAISSSNLVVKSIPAKGENEVSFRFNVSREARINGKDTLRFLVSDKSGGTWSKSIIVSYTPPATFALDQNFPNPFNPSTTIYYQLPSPSHVSIRVYDLLGREVRTLVDEEKAPGLYEAKFTATNIASGTYYCRMEAKAGNGNAFTQVRKMLVVK
jgi:hypothetical protein